MEKLVRVCLKNKRKIYSFMSGGKTYKPKQTVVVKTARGLECGKVVDFDPCKSKCSSCKCKNNVSKHNKIIRVANRKDLDNFNKNKAKAASSLLFFKKKILKHGLNMKPIDAEYTLDSKKVIFYFSSEQRVDFRGLVKDLALEFKIRIELRQIGTRDESKMIGGLGVCGRPFCCSTFLKDFKSVLIKSAKDQGIHLSPSKISGNCGRLMCCLKYEEESYLKFLEITPKVGEMVKTSRGEGEVIETNFLTGNLKVKLKSEALHAKFNRKEVTVIMSGEEEKKDEQSEPLKV